MYKKPNPKLCTQCKGSRRLCGLPQCPILVKLREQLSLSRHLGTSLESHTPPSILVGEYGYPCVRVGVNLPVGEEAPELFENPREWWGRLGLLDILRLRARLVYSYAKLPVKRLGGRVVNAVRESAMSYKPVDSEAIFKRPPVFAPRFDPLLKPLGFSGEAESIRVLGNPSVPRRVDSLALERVRAERAIIELYRAGFDVYYLQRLLSAGVLGVEKRFVPTRWAITAVDKKIGDFLLDRIRDRPEITDYEVYHSNYIGNNYTLVLIPGPWSMEMIEAWLPGSMWVPSGGTEIYDIHEWEDGRPSREDGGYYAIRVAVLESLAGRGRQAGVLAIREITPEYFAPVGNWQIRESVRRALSGRAERASSLEEALQIASKYLLMPLDVVEEKSELLRRVRRQARLPSFLARE
ncbi:hypothetical protein IG193_02820 [Infirmifilum lucidum]|uniref:DNA repair protein n=1 Tax=Infirmifilum lucidum TaxID=2776706 RepID=A0A7L9FJ91_9CREN|nr:Nre family DNA repair protein [Infirmifilum lucidum]QOJ79412.1 hypothetical protein IG193_02820 [Infirmifilum lucidum]